MYVGLEEKEIKIVALGDSITNGVQSDGSVKEEDTFRYLLQQSLIRSTGRKIKVINAGVNADVSTLAINRLERDVLRHKPHFVTIMFGVNDAGFFRPDGPVADTPRVSKEDFESTLLKMIDQISKIGAQPILVTPVPMSPSYHLADYPPYVEHGLNYLVDEYSDIIRRLAKDVNLPLIDVHRKFSEDPETQEFVPDRQFIINQRFIFLTTNGIHPDKRGHKLIAEIYYDVLSKII